MPGRRKAIGRCFAQRDVDFAASFTFICYIYLRKSVYHFRVRRKSCIFGIDRTDNGLRTGQQSTRAAPFADNNGRFGRRLV